METPIATDELLTALKNRHSIYSLSKASTISDSRIMDIIEEIVLHTPSAFNSQTTRIVLLLGENHNQLWDITTEVLRATVPEERFASTLDRMNAFRNAYGTVLFFEEQAIVEELQEKFPTYQERFPIWSQHTNAMHQLMVWTVLSNEGIGASLQHYNPIIDEQVKAQWSLPESWQLVAQMPFGKPTDAPPEGKEKKPIYTRFLVFD